MADDKKTNDVLEAESEEKAPEPKEPSESEILSVALNQIITAIDKLNISQRARILATAIVFSGSKNETLELLSDSE